MSDTVQYVLPFTATGFCLLAAARALRLIATPGALLEQPAFLLQVLLLGLLGVNVWLFHTGVFKSVDGWELGPAPPRARATGAISLVLFTGIVGTACLIR
jgi:hypothetical protein